MRVEPFLFRVPRLHVVSAASQAPTPVSDCRSAPSGAVSVISALMFLGPKFLTWYWTVTMASLSTATSTGSGVAEAEMVTPEIGSATDVVSVASSLPGVGSTVLVLARAGKAFGPGMPAEERSKVQVIRTGAVVSPAPSGLTR